LSEMVAKIQDKLFAALVEEDCGIVKSIRETKWLDLVGKVVVVFGTGIWELGTVGLGQVAQSLKFQRQIAVRRPDSPRD
jgi:hypothetical protein